MNRNKSLHFFFFDQNPCISFPPHIPYHRVIFHRTLLLKKWNSSKVVAPFFLESLVKGSSPSLKCFQIKKKKRERDFGFDGAIQTSI